MSVGSVILIVIVVVLLVAALTLVTRRAALRRQYGGEYDRLVRETGRRRANAEFAKRRHRVDGLNIKPLSTERRSAYEAQWAIAQERFIDNPAQSVKSAANLVTAVAAERGYPVDDSEQLLSDLSVHHGRQLDGYRLARQVTVRIDRASTEGLRQALLGHRALFLDLLGPAAGSTSGAARREDRAAVEAAPAPAQHRLPLQRAFRKDDGAGRRPESEKTASATPAS